MILVIDANVLISEMLRHKGRERIQDPRMTLFATEKVLGEANYEIPRREALTQSSADNGPQHRPS